VTPRRDSTNHIQVEVIVLTNDGNPVSGVSVTGDVKQGGTTENYTFTEVTAGLYRSNCSVNQYTDQSNTNGTVTVTGACTMTQAWVNSDVTNGQPCQTTSTYTPTRTNTSTRTPTNTATVTNTATNTPTVTDTPT